MKKKITKTCPWCKELPYKGRKGIYCNTFGCPATNFPVTLHVWNKQADHEQSMKMLRAVYNYRPKEIIYDEFAYGRIVSFYKKSIQDILKIMGEKP